jgi:hypothetical protein
VTKFDSLTAGLSSSLSDLSNTPPPARVSKLSVARLAPIVESPLRMDLGGLRAEPSLLEEQWDGGFDDESFDAETRAMFFSSPKRAQIPAGKSVLEGKENRPA